MIWHDKWGCIYASVGEARYDDNNKKVLQSLAGNTNRKAKFVTCICLKLEGETHFFRGEVEGFITEEARGTRGFGFDPIFTPYDATVNGLNQTYAEMSLETKNLYSHRQKSLRKLFTTLKRLRP